MVLVVVVLHVAVEVGHIRQHPEVGVVQDLVGVHPEDVRHGVGLGGGLQLGPVLVPAGDLHVDDDVGMLGRVGVADGHHAVALVDVPDLERQVRFAIGGSAAAQAEQQREGQSDGSDAGDLFHNSTPLLQISHGSSKLHKS